MGRLDGCRQSASLPAGWPRTKASFRAAFRCHARAHAPCSRARMVPYLLPPITEMAVRRASVLPLVLAVLLLSAPAAATAQTTYSLYGCHDTWSCHWATVVVTPDAATGNSIVEVWARSAFYNAGLIRIGTLFPFHHSLTDLGGYYTTYRRTDGFYGSGYSPGAWSPDELRLFLSYGPEGGLWPTDETGTGVAHLTVTPEPTTTALAATGLALLAAVRRRQRREGEEITRI